MNRSKTNFDNFFKGKMFTVFVVLYLRLIIIFFLPVLEFIFKSTPLTLSSMCHDVAFRVTETEARYNVLHVDRDGVLLTEHLIISVLIYQSNNPKMLAR